MERVNINKRIDINKKALKRKLSNSEEISNKTENIEKTHQSSEDSILQPTKLDEVKFAHESEREFARILDFYRIKWEYEPRTFVLERDAEGNPTVSFTPDFYLPELDLYIELTTLNQRLVTRKNRKIKALKKLYPDINIKLFYKKDYHSLLFKYINR
ncbi:MAG: hypothetical protein H5T85_02465 [Actinobacteria bacterium]|nr:hypothetical protein [Actinomycetota bacterium]